MLIFQATRIHSWQTEMPAEKRQTSIVNIGTGLSSRDFTKDITENSLLDLSDVSLEDSISAHDYCEQ